MAIVDITGTSIRGKVLMIDDEPCDLRLLEAKLKHAGYDTICADNAKEGIKLAYAEKPDIILLDIMMPDMDGYEVTQRLKADPVTSNIPIVLITVLEETSDKLRGMEAGADDFLNKPVNTGELLARIQAVLLRMKIKLQMETQIREATLQSITDPLTGLYNRQFIKHDIERHVLQAQRYEQPMSLFFIDVDHFKHINDTYGHATGDSILKILSRCFKNSLRGSDIVARYGGDEFIVCLPGTDHPAAMQVAEKIRTEIANLDHDLPDGCKISVSIGLTEMQQDENFNSMLNRADKAMYQAKVAGRNRVETVLPGQSIQREKTS